MTSICHKTFAECERNEILSRISELAFQDGDGLTGGLQFFDPIFNSEGEAIQYLKSQDSNFTNLAVRYRVIDTTGDTVLCNLYQKRHSLMNASFDELKAISKAIELRFIELARASKTIRWMVKFEYLS